jgi:hypothetical protein
MKNSQNMATTKKKPLAEIFVNIRHENNNLDLKKTFHNHILGKKNFKYGKNVITSLSRLSN